MSKDLSNEPSKDLNKETSKDLSKDSIKDLSKKLTKNLSKELERTKRKEKERKDREKAEAQADKQPLLGTSKAVETMFRNALRAELDLIALAATKANIMISLNGVIISVLMISGAFIFASSPTFIIPAGIFMFTALASILFAILSASPEKAHFFNGFSSWFGALLKREAGFGDLRTYLDRANQSGDDGDDLNLLINTDRMMLSREEYWEQMQLLIQDRDETYRAMSYQLYWLGQMSARKFKLLNVSYAAFRWGLLISVLASLILHSLLFLYPNVLEKPPARLTESGMGAFSGLYEPSGAQQLPDGNMLVVEDEAKRAMNILTVAPDGGLVENAISNLRLTRSFGRELNDLEGLAADAQGFIYATTSHSSDKNGIRQPAREQLLRFNVKGSKAGNIATVTTLRDALTESQLIAAAIRARTGEDANFDKLDIEGLVYYDKTQELLLGLRDPVVSNLTMIVPITNPAEMFDNDAAPAFGEPIFLDIEGGGIRSLHFDKALDRFIIANELEDEEGDKFSQIWTWSGNAQDETIPMDLPQLLDLKNIEAISTITVDGESKLVFMADEGDAKKGVHARYVILDYEEFTK